MERSQFRAVFLDVLVAVPTSIPGRHIRVTGHIHEGMAVAAVEAELLDMDLM
jgi:hypothetical protein